MSDPIPIEPVRLALHQGQAAVWKSRARFKVVVAGRRWGKTRTARAFLQVGALSTRHRRWWYIAPTRDDARDILWEELKRTTDPSWMAGAPSETELSIPFVTGSEVRLLSGEKGDSLRGRPLGGLVMDEYADMEARLFHEILRPSLADYHAPALFVGTPKAFNHFHELFLRGQSPEFPEWQSWQFRSLDNPFLDASEIEDARRSTDPRTFRQEWEASFEALAGRVYYAFSRQAHVAAVELERALPVVVSCDFNVDPCCAIIGQRRGDDVWVWREVKVRHAGGEATRAMARAARAHLAGVGWDGPIRIHGDPAGRAAKTTGPADHAVLREVFPSASWQIPSRAPHVRDRIAAVNGRCESADGRAHCRIDPSCVGLIADLEQVIFADNGEIDKKSNPELTHLSDAFGYWVEREWPSKSRITVGTAMLPDW